MKAYLRHLVKLPVLLIATGVLALPATALAARNYTATISPSPVTAGSVESYTLIITNDASSQTGSSIKSATVGIPAGFSASGPSVTSSAGTWTVDTFDGTTLSVKKSGSSNVGIGGTITITFGATAPCVAGEYTFPVSAFQEDNYTNAFTQVGTAAKVTVTGTCVTPTGFEVDDFCTVGQGGWGSPPNGGNPGELLATYFDALYTDLVVGNPLSLTFNAAVNVNEYLPAGKTPGVLTGSLVNPTSTPTTGTPSGVFGGQVTALRLNVDFNDAGHNLGLLGTVSTLVLGGTGTSLDGASVADVLAAAETALGGGGLPAGIDSVSAFNELVTNLNEAFEECVPSDWALTHLSLPD